MTPFNPGNAPASRDLGHEIDLLATISLTPRMDVLLGYSHFFSGDYYRAHARPALPRRRRLLLRPVSLEFLNESRDPDFIALAAPATIPGSRFGNSSCQARPAMSFRSVFIALVIGFGLVLAAFLVNAQRPRVEVEPAHGRAGAGDAASAPSATRGCSTRSSTNTN